MTRRIAIIGGGAAGTLVALHLAQLATKPTNVVLIEPRARLGEGAAYSTTDAAHVLNVPAISMSAYPDDASHFVRWAKCLNQTFTPRHHFADYLRFALASELEHHAHLSFRHHVGRAQSITMTPLRVTDGTAHHDVDAVVLALGNSPPTQPDWVQTMEKSKLIVDPWATGALDSIPSGSRVLCIGTGLTFVDVTLALTRRGCTLVGTSRHGLLPTSHHTPSSDLPALPYTTTTPLALLRWLRSQPDWRSAFTAMRPETQRLWSELGTGGQRQFLQHARRYWDVHRHRMSPEVAEAFAALQQNGSVQVIRGNAGMQAHSPSFDRVVLCTGPDDATALTTAPLASLVANGWVRSGPHGIGVDTVTNTGQVVNNQGVPSDRIYAIGELRRGTLWESTAIPEIRSQARQLATLLLA